MQDHLIVKEQEGKQQLNIEIEPQEQKSADSIPSSENNLDNISTLIYNMKWYCSILIAQEMIPSQVLEIYKPIIINQIIDIQTPQQSIELSNVQIVALHDLVNKFNARSKIQEYNLFQNLDQFNKIIHQLYAHRLQRQYGSTSLVPHQSKKRPDNQIKKLNIIISALWNEMEEIFQQDSFTIQRLQNYNIYKNNVTQIQLSEDFNIPQTHYNRQYINCNIEYPLQIYSNIQPPLHRKYVNEVVSVYHEVAPVRIKNIIPNKEGPIINIPNYYNNSLEMQKAILCYPIPKTKKILTYIVQDICNIPTMQKQYIREIQLPTKWQFSNYTKLVVTPDGLIFGINCRTTQSKIDHSIYEIAEDKVTNRGKQIQPKRQSSILYFNGAIYVIGGRGPHENCSNRNFRYLIKQKKWEEIAQSNMAVRKPIVCVFGKFILKIGGINEFNYLSKTIQMYDSNANAWGLVRASSRSALEQVQILQDSLAVQINDDQIFIFGGKNANKFCSDTGFIMRINQIRERKNKCPKVSSEMWNVSIGKRIILSYFGLLSQMNVITYGNCIYALRSSISKPLPQQL